MKIWSLLAAAPLSLLLPAPTAHAAAPSNVVATTEDLGSIAREVGGDKIKVTNGAKKGAVREKLVIELLGGSRYMGEGRYYLIKSQPPARTLGEVEEHIKDKSDKLLVHVLITDESVAASHPAVARPPRSPGRSSSS